jgi:hypothetical protein
LARAFEASVEHAMHRALHGRTRHRVALFSQATIVHALLMRGDVATEIRHRLVGGAGRRTQAREGVHDHAGIPRQDLDAHVVRPGPRAQTARAPERIGTGVQVFAEMVIVQDLEVKVPWWPETLFFVPTLRDAEALWREGVARGRSWTASELFSILAGAPWTQEALTVVMIARREFGGEVITVRRSSRSSI